MVNITKQFSIHDSNSKDWTSTLSSIRKAALRWGLRLVLKKTKERCYTEY